VFRTVNVIKNFSVGNVGVYTVGETVQKRKRKCLTTYILCIIYKYQERSISHEIICAYILILFILRKKNENIGEITKYKSKIFSESKFTSVEFFRVTTHCVKKQHESHSKV
jgi:hypothetical protein